MTQNQTCDVCTSCITLSSYACAVDSCSAELDKTQQSALTGVVRLSIGLLDRPGSGAVAIQEHQGAECLTDVARVSRVRRVHSGGLLRRRWLAGRIDGLPISGVEAERHRSDRLVGVDELDHRIGPRGPLVIRRDALADRTLEHRLQAAPGVAA